ncbi:MDR family MFS transporter [Nocardia carnea]|uniref:MDR family MFS transporter n=1 Tax=Nocardia carnea TaxID=37328 RepID=UPI0024578009|nr:MDR family MFS transporter [Nocardia carnea]
MVADTAKAGVGLRSDRGAILGSLMLATGLIALDSTIIATAVLSITASLGGFAQFPWLFSIYLLAQAVTVPIYGKVADMVGRKPVILFGIAVFALGSLLCGLAGNMLWLIVFRGIQGIGAGAIQPMTMTIAGDIYTLAERAKAQGYIAGVWALSSVAGPLLGGVFADYLGWRWIFLINLPLSAWAAWMLSRHFAETVPRQRTRLDYPGTILLTSGAGAVILGLLEGGRSWGWASPAGIGIFAGGAAALVAFVLVERRAANPILPLWLFTRRVVVASSAISLLVGALLLGLTSYVPTFTQGVLGASALVSGLTVGALTLGWPLSASQSGRVYMRIGFRFTAVLGGVFATIGASATLFIGPGSSIGQIAATCFLIGLGMGLVASPTLIAAQTAASWNERGVVTSANMFARSIGSAVGVAVFGALVNSRVGDAAVPAPDALAEGVHLVFVAVLVMTVAIVGTGALMPGRSASGR